MSAFDKVIGYESIKMEMKRYCDILKNPKKYEKLGVNIPSGLLLEGEPGLGKTLMAKCFIAESGCKVFTLRKEKPNGEFVNEIKDVFEQAKAENTAIVFLDDMDKFANEDENHPNAEEYVTIQSCIDDCKGQGVFILATVNDIQRLPKSLRRVGRFDKIISVDVPEYEDGIRIIEQYLNKMETMEDIDAELVARMMEGESCAKLETVINEAGIYAGFENRGKICQQDLTNACLQLIFHSPEELSECDKSKLKVIAIHEAGHAVISEILEPGSVNFSSVRSGKNSSNIGGMTRYRKMLDTVVTYKKWECNVLRDFGGRAATEVVLGELDMGCESDLIDAFETIDDALNLGLYGFENADKYRNAEYEKEQEVRAISMEAERLYSKAKKIIIDNRAFLDAVVEGLLDKKTLTFRDIQDIKKSLQLVV